MALAGGVSLQIPPNVGYLYQEGMIASPDGHCRAFDAQAQGTVISSGLGLVVVRRLNEALAAGDHIYAIIRGSAINNDGHAKIGYTAPSIDGQAMAIALAHEVAGIRAETIHYIEAHGTGTVIGDPIEIAALTKAFRRHTHQHQFCALGSVKTNIGHCDAAAGIAGLIKTVLALHHGELPPSLHYKQANPNIDFATSPFYVNTSLSQWPSRDGIPRRAGVSSFGIGGTNAHVIVEEAPPHPATSSSRSCPLLLLSAKTPSALETATTRLAQHIETHPDVPLADIAYTLQVGRTAFAQRRMLLCYPGESHHQIASRLRDTFKTQTHSAAHDTRPVVFLFPGQGTQYVGMTRALYEKESFFREQVDNCCQRLKYWSDIDLHPILYADTLDENAQTRLHDTRYTQPALFIVSYALAQLWMHWGIHPQAMLGHSLGEYVAACLAGVFSLDDALRLVATRGWLIHGLEKGAMLAVSLNERDLIPFLSDDLSLAAVNSPTACVASGPTSAIDALHQRLSAHNVDSQRLTTSHAFHSSMLDPILHSFANEVAALTLKAPTRPYLSNVSGTWITAQQATDPHYWVAHLRGTVRFTEGAHCILQSHANALFLEVGPGRVF